MALKESNRVKLMIGTSGGSLVADADESFRIKEIFCVPSAADDYLTLITQGTTVGLMRVKGKAGNHLPYPFVKTAQIYEAMTGGLMAWLKSIGLDLFYPVASGETFTVSRAAEAGNVALVYDVYDAGDVSPDEPNGSLSRIRRYVHYATNAAAITTTPAAIDSSLMWSGGEGWPIDASGVAEKNVFRLVAILAAPVSHGDAAANKGYSTHLQLIHRNNILLDEDRSGLPFKGDSAHIADSCSYVSLGSVIGPLTAENPAPGLVFNPPMEFGEGDKLTTKLVMSGAAATGVAASEADVVFALEHEYLP